MTTLRDLVLPFLLVSVPVAQDAIIVDAAGGGDFTTIQAAVDAAPAGGLIRVRHGNYPDPVLITKGLRLIGDRFGNGLGMRAEIAGDFVVRDLLVDQAFFASLPGRPVPSPIGSIHLDIPSSVIIHFGGVSAFGVATRLPFPRLWENWGIPITFQAAELVDGRLRITAPSTIVL